MNGIKIVESKNYLPKKHILNEELERKFDLEKSYLKKRTGIEKRNYISNEKIEELALKSVEKLDSSNLENIGLIIVATTSTNILMPGISNYIQKKIGLKKCICLDILAGCSGYINALDIAKMYIQTGKVNKALIIGVDLLSKTIDKKDLDLLAVLSDGAGAIIIEKTNEEKLYYSNIVSEPDNDEILVYRTNSKMNMKGKEVYKYAVTKTVENINKLLEISHEKLENIKYIIPHQSNLKIMNSIANRLNIDKNKMYVNIQDKGNSFCATIPIAISEMIEKNMLKSGDKIILLGYGGGINTGSILLEI